ncbi:D-glucuronyl C5-epimerase family protein [Achromobacter insuavis]
MKNILIKMVAAVLLAGSASAIAGPCPAIGAAPRTISSSAEIYATTNGFSLREDGVVLYDYGKAFNGLGKWADPFFNSNYALGLYRDYLASNCSDDSLREKFLGIADWMISEGKTRGDMLVWEYPFSDPNFQLEPGWISGIGQSRMASVLLRAHAVTGKDRYKAAAEAAMRAYEHTISDGGVMVYEGDAAWLEEMADIKGNSFKVLNGHITGLAGILDYYAITKDKKWMHLVERGVAAVKRDIPKFDAGFSSYYSLKMPSNARPIAPRVEYNALHVSQLIWMYENFGDPVFLKWAMRFHAYDMNNDQYSASSSIDPINHGPAALRGLYGDHYWSASKFPVDVLIKLNHGERITGVALDVNTYQERPINFSVQARLLGKVVSEKSVSANSEKNLDVLFDSPISADEVVVTFRDTADKDILAIKSLMVLRAIPKYSAIANDCNFRIRGMEDPADYNLNDALNFGESQMITYCAGWVLSLAVKG